MINQLRMPFYCLTSQIILCSLELYSNIPIQWVDYSIHHLFEINMSNKYFFCLSLALNVTSFLQALIRLSLKRAPSFTAIKAFKLNSTKALSRGRPRKMMLSRQHVLISCSHPLEDLEDPLSSTSSTGKTHGKCLSRNANTTVPISSCFLGKGTKCCATTKALHGCQPCIP